MQTTLLGLAIAFILALIAALIGPYFVDWNQFRSQFEAEATRIVGAPVRVDGMLDARILPTPSLRLRSVAVGAATSGRMRADRLDVEFSLGSLMRGEWRASELSIGGFDLDFGLDRQGRVEGPVPSGRFNLGSLAIDRLDLVGRVTLRDAASGKSFELDDVRFAGDVRSLAGTMRGEGSFVAMGERTPFRISSGQSADGKGTRLRFIADPGDKAVFADFDGVLTFNGSVPKFDGTLTVAQPADDKLQRAASTQTATPWRVSSRVKMSPASASLEQIEAAYGPEETALRLSGAGDLRFGAAPLLRIALSARQLDADRLLNRNAKTGEPLRIISGLRRAIAALPVTPIPIQASFNADQIALGGRPVQNATLELRSDTKTWTIDQFDLRAPGATRIAATGTISNSGHLAAFLGPVILETADPDTFAAWLKGSSEIAYRSQKPVRLRGQTTIAADRLGIDGMKAESDGDAIEGRILLRKKDDGYSRLEAVLTSGSFNLDAAGALIGGLPREAADWPDEAKISISIARATLAGQTMRPALAEISYAPQLLSLDRLKIGEAGGVAMNGSGSFDRSATAGKFSLQASAPSLGHLGDLIAPLAPPVAQRLKAALAMPGDARVQLGIDVAPSADASRAVARAVLDIDAPQAKGAVILSAAPPRDAARDLDLAALGRSEIRIESKIAWAQASGLLTLLGLDRILSAGDGSAQFEGSATGLWRDTFQVQAKVAGADLDGELQGTLDAWAEPAKANLNLALRRADPSVVFGLKPGSIAAKDFALSSRLGVTGGNLVVDDLDSTIVGSRVRGRIAVTTGEPADLKGEVGIDTLDLTSMVGFALGATGRDQAEPLGRGMLNGWRGSLSFESLNATLPGGLALRPFGGVLRSDGQSLMLDNGKGKLAGGELSASADARRSPDGTAVNLRIRIDDADGAALRPRGLKLPEGTASLEVALASQGRSAAALFGAMSGNGTVSIKDARIDGLDTRAFEAAVRASDDGRPTDDLNLRPIVEQALAGGSLSLPRLRLPFAVKEGRLRVAPTAVEATGARVTFSGAYDIAADQADARIVLSANVVNPATGRPDIRIDLNGAPDSLVTNLDVASLSSWLAMRLIDRETRKLDRLERGMPAGAEPQAETMSLEVDLPKIDPLPLSEVKIPNRDPRKRTPNAKGVSPADASGSPPRPNAASGSSASQLQPLPPPVSIQPAPGSAKPKPRPPVVLAPPASSSNSF